MQDNLTDGELLEFLVRFGPQGMSREFADQLVALASEPERRYSSDELLALAAVHDKGFHRRTLSDWPKWGLLALSSPSGRGPGGGVERTWTAPQVQVFLMVVRKRLQDHWRRSELANIPVFLWLLLGPEYVPHEQVRRALATWSKASRRLSPYGTVGDNYHAVLRSPRVQELLEQGSLSRREVHTRAEAAPTVDDLNGLARYLGSFGSPNGTGMPSQDEINEMTRRHTLSIEARHRGMDELPTVSDMLLDATRSSYLDSANVDFLPDLDADCAELAAAVASTRFKTETETACANALTFLGVVCQERPHPTIGVEELLRAGRELAAEIVDDVRSVFRRIETFFST